MLHEWYKSYAWYPVRRAARDPKRNVGGASRNAGSCPDCRNSSPWSRLSPLERKAVVRFPPLVAQGVPQEQTSANQQSRADKLRHHTSQLTALLWANRRHDGRPRIVEKWNR